MLRSIGFNFLAGQHCGLLLEPVCVGSLTVSTRWCNSNEWGSFLFSFRAEVCPDTTLEFRPPLFKNRISEFLFFKWYHSSQQNSRRLEDKCLQTVVTLQLYKWLYRETLFWEWSWFIQNHNVKKEHWCLSLLSVFSRSLWRQFCRFKGGDREMFLPQSKVL